MAQNVRTPNAFITAALSAADTATLGYLPQLAEMVSDVPADQLRAEIAAGQAANPRAATIGTVGGYLVPGGVAVKGLNVARNALGLGAAAAARAPGVMSALKAAGSTAGAAGRKMLGPAGVVGAGATLDAIAGSREEAPPPAAETAAAPAATNAPAPQRPMGSREFWASRLGVRPEDVDAMRNQYGGIPMFALDKLSSTRLSAPSYKNQFGQIFMDLLNNEAAQVMQSGDPEQIRAFQSRVRQEILPTLGGNPYMLDTSNME